MAIVYGWYENPNAEWKPERVASPSAAQREGKHGATLSSGARPQFAYRRRCKKRNRHFAPTLEATQKVTRKTKNKHKSPSPTFRRLFQRES